MRKRTLAEKHELRLAKKDYRLSLKSGNHNAGRHELIKALADGLKNCNYQLRIPHIPAQLKGQK